MRPVKMDRTGLLAAAIYAILENRRDKKLIGDFSVVIELMPTVINGQIMFGSTISGYIKTKNHINGKDFTVYLTDYEIKIEIPRKTVLYPLNTQAVTYIDVKEPIEIDFEKRSITYKKVYNFSTENVMWDWQAVKGTAADIIGAILGEENS